MEKYGCPNCGVRFVSVTDLVDAADEGCDTCGQKFEVTEDERLDAFQSSQCHSHGGGHGQRLF